VRIADTAEAFVAAIEAARADDRVSLTAAADAFLEDRSWDETWSGMSALIQRVLVDAEANGDQDRARPLAGTAVGSTALESPAGASSSSAARRR
jgi:hypothetical protein